MGVSYLLLLSCLGLAVTAQAQNCDRPTGNPHTTLSDSDILLQTFPDKTKVTFICEVGYVSAGGSRTITCTAGSWSSLRLKCERRNCGSAGEVENGLIDYPEGTEFGDKLVIRCNSGHRLVGKNEILCGILGWEDRLPTCEVVTCDPPPNVANGSFSPNSETYQYSEVIQYRCQTDYTLNGSTSRVCSDNGEFQPHPPTCIKVKCNDTDIENADWVDGSRPPYGHLATVTYKCRSGYNMIGTATQTCQINSNWSPGLPRCEKIEITTKATTTTATTTTGPYSTKKPTEIEITTKATITTTTTQPYSTKKPTAAPDPSNVPENNGNNWQMALGTSLGVIIGIGVLIFCGWYFCGVPGFIKKKHGSRNSRSDKEAAKEGEALTLSSNYPVGQLPALLL